MADDDRVVLIPRKIERDERLVVRGDPKSGIANLRMRVSIEHPGFALEIGGKDLALRIANRIRDRLSQLYAEGRDARGSSLPALKAATIKRRERRRRQVEDDTAAKFDRFTIRGGRNKGKAYDTTDTRTPFHESGAMAENVSVTFKGRDSGDVVFLISWPSGGKYRTNYTGNYLTTKTKRDRKTGEVEIGDLKKESFRTEHLRGLVGDDGRGARLFAVEHYGADRMAGIPPDLDRWIDQALESHLGAVIAAGRGIMNVARSLQRVVDKAGQLAETATNEETGE